MQPIWIFIIFATFVGVAWFIGTYNRLVKYKNRIEEAWSGIDIALKRRHNLIPNLIRAIEGYGAHESKIFKSQYDGTRMPTGVSNRVEKENQISKSLSGLLALAQAYPELKASTNFLDLQNSLDEIEEEVQNARKKYNRYVGRLNTLIESFPAKIIARKFGFDKRNYFTLDLATQRDLPQVDFTPPREAGD